MIFECTLTDTFGGELNYSWARRATIEAPSNASDSLLIRRAKRALGISGRHRLESWGETLAVFPVGTCTAITIEPKESET